MYAVGAISSARCNGELTGKVMLCEAPMRVIATLTGDAVQLGNGQRAVGAILSARCNGELTQSSVTTGHGMACCTRGMPPHTQGPQNRHFGHLDGHAARDSAYVSL